MEQIDRGMLPVVATRERRGVEVAPCREGLRHGRSVVRNARLGVPSRAVTLSRCPMHCRDIDAALYSDEPIDLLRFNFRRAPACHARASGETNAYWKVDAAAFGERLGGP